MTDPAANKKQLLKELIRELHAGARPEEVKEKFKAVLRDAAPTEIAQIEEELIKEGMGREEIQRLCDVHLAVFKESLEQQKPMAPPGHPVHILMAEHTILLQFADQLRETIPVLKPLKDFAAARDELESIDTLCAYFKESANHYLREENVLFPYLEKHGITQPPAMMWSEHDKIRDIEKNLYRLIDTRETVGFHNFTRQLAESALALADMLSSHFYKENNILFPAGFKVIEEHEWHEIKNQFDEIGYCSFTPPAARAADAGSTQTVAQAEVADMVYFETGNISKKELEAIFNTLPVDITFIDSDDTVRYFSESKDRIFLRTKAIIGRKVQQCHPHKSLAVVNQILADFKNGTRSNADFWIEVESRLIYIRYFAVRDKQNHYLGCIEVTQNISPIKQIEGEKRLL